MTGRGIHHALGSSCAALIPATLRACGILRVPLSATGRGWAHSPSSWQRPAPGRRAEWLEIREAPVATVAGKVAQQRACRRLPALRAQGAMAKARQRAEPEAKALLPGTQIADAGAARQPTGPEQGLREPDGVPREAQPAPPGPGGTGPRVADEAPAYPSHLRPHRRGRTARGRARRPTSRMSISQTRPSLSAFDAAPRLTSGRRALRRSPRTRA